MRPEMKLHSTLTGIMFTLVFHCERNEMKFRFGDSRSGATH